MAGRIPDEILDIIRERTSIVEVVSGHVALRKSGRGFSGLCPFHSEKTPSFTVSEDRGLYHCFGCGEGGTVFTFVMKMEGLDFRAAVEQLAQRAGVRLPEESDGGRGDDRRRLIQLNEAAQRRYVAALASEQGAEALAYLQRRGLSDDIVENYGIGFCPPAGSPFLRAVQGRAQAVEAALGIGLLGRRDDGRLYERQWGRITFPIRDGSGRLIGFGGRALGDRQPKYLNSPESSLFHKGYVLYGLFEGRAAIREAGRVVVVEGYMDAISLAQHGFGNVVANLGTALTESQLRLASRFADEVVAFFDGDRAGQAAAMRAFEVCVVAGIWARGAFLPQGQDPDSFVREQGVGATRALLDQAIPLSAFFLERVDPRMRAAAPQREAAARRVGEILGRVGDPVRFTMLAKEAAERLGVDEAMFRELRARPSRRAAARRPDDDGGRPDVPAPETSLNREEASLIEVMVVDHGACGVVLECDDLAELLGADAMRLAHAVLDAWEEHGDARTVLDQLPGGIGSRASAALLGTGPLAEADRAKVASDCLRRLRERADIGRARRLRMASIKPAESKGDLQETWRGLEEANEILRLRRAKAKRSTAGEGGNA